MLILEWIYAFPLGFFCRHFIEAVLYKVKSNFPKFNFENSVIGNESAVWIEIILTVQRLYQNQLVPNAPTNGVVIPKNVRKCSKTQTYLDLYFLRVLFQYF